MKRQRKPTFREMANAVELLPAPRSQPQWRETSTAMRAARRAWQRGDGGRTITVRSSARRYLYLNASYGGMATYNGPSPVSNIGMIAFQRRRYLEGDRELRVEHARQFAAASRRDGPVRLP